MKEQELHKRFKTSAWIYRVVYLIWTNQTVLYTCYNYDLVSTSRPVSPIDIKHYSTTYIRHDFFTYKASPYKLYEVATASFMNKV